MKKILLITLLLVPGIAVAEMPTQVGGFVLNTDVERYQDRLKPETTLPIRFMEAIKEVETRHSPGFKSGYIAYGSCAAPGKIVRIKLKYEDGSKGFYEKLLDSYRDKFGKPQWLGDPFHVVSTWKWSFGEGEQKVDLYLQHNLSDKDEKFGNSVKLTMVNMVEQEMACFVKQNPDFRGDNPAVGKGARVKWEDLLPD